MPWRAFTGFLTNPLDVRSILNDPQRQIPEKFAGRPQRKMNRMVGEGCHFAW
jgi:hypothetical protein